MYLCIYDTDPVTVAPVSLVADCSGFVAQDATNFGADALTYAQADSLIGATAVLFACAFIIRVVLKLIFNK